jgi:hypothetical protein
MNHNGLHFILGMYTNKVSHIPVSNVCPVREGTSQGRKFYDTTCTDTPWTQLLHLPLLLQRSPPPSDNKHFRLYIFLSTCSSVIAGMLSFLETL